MLLEQQKTIQTFRKSFSPDSMERFVIYGTGINAEAIVKACREYPIAGLMDASRTGQSLWGLPVLSEEEVSEKNIRLVIVAARPAVHRIIYKRIRSWCENTGVSVLDIQGDCIADKIKVPKCESVYFDVSYDALLREIDCHDVISFDIFDTLLIRKVYEPHDVFSLLDREYGAAYPFVFSVERKRAENMLLERMEPNIYQIYEQMKKNHPVLSDQNCEKMLHTELKKEMQVLVPRKKMRECLQYCADHGKRVFLVSDMYLPEAVLSEMLADYGIAGYEKLFVSCDRGISKRNGLFRLVKNYVNEAETCLHIGDHPEADGKAAEKEGFDSFLIHSPVKMMELSTYAPLLSWLGGIESRLMLGLLASRLFSDPFSLYHSEGKPDIEESQSFGYLLIAPLVISFLIWMMERVCNAGQAVILFSARDGWLMRKVYRQLAERFQIKHMPRDEYLLISRKAVIGLETRQDRKADYLAYLADLKLEAYDKIYFFDFMSKGTCQYYLEQLLHRSFLGLYFQKSDSPDKEKGQLNVESYFKEHCAQETDRSIFALCDFLECIFTSFDPSFLEFRGRTAVYEEERRTAGQLACIKGIHEGIQKYAEQFAEILGKMPEKMPAVDFCDELLKYISASYSNIKIPELTGLVLDDAFFGDKNTGKDALI